LNCKAFSNIRRRYFNFRIKEKQQKENAFFFEKDKRERRKHQL